MLRWASGSLKREKAQSHTRDDVPWRDVNSQHVSFRRGMAWGNLTPPCDGPTATLWGFISNAEKGEQQGSTGINKRARNQPAWSATRTLPAYRLPPMPPVPLLLSRLCVPLTGDISSSP